MIPVFAMPASAQVTPPVHTAVVVGAPTEISTIKLPIDAVPASLSSEPTFNNARGGGAWRTATPPNSATAASAAPPFTPVIPGLVFRPSVQFSTPFLAQLLAQTPGTQAQAMTALFTHEFTNDNLPRGAPDSALMSLYADVKHKPGNTAMPRGASEEAASFARAQPGQRADLFAAQNLQARGKTGMSASESISPFFSRPRPPARAGNGAAPFRMALSVAVAKPFRSLITPRGVDAYIASFSRSASTIHGADSPDVKMAL
jgi:hypothetical protein